MLRIATRASLALGSAALGVAAAAPPRPDPATASDPAAAAAQAPLPFADCGLAPVPLAGSLQVQGSPVRAAVAFTGHDPSDVLACQRAHFERQPVDLQELPGALVVRDHLAGRTLVVAARPLATGSTQVVMGEQAGPAAARAAPPPGLPLPPGITVATRVDDRSGGETVTTLAGICRGDPRDVLAALERVLGDAGWKSAPAGEGAARVFTRGARTLVAALAAGPAGCTFSLRVMGGDAP